MAFDTFSAFIAMEGHGPYVWACYAVFLVMLIGMMVWSARSNRQVLGDCRRRYRQQAQSHRASSGSRPEASFTRVDISRD